MPIEFSVKGKLLLSIESVVMIVILLIETFFKKFFIVNRKVKISISDRMSVGKFSFI